MKLFIEDKIDLENFLSKIENYLNGTYLKLPNKKIKECVAISLKFKELKSIEKMIPFNIETETFFLDYMNNHTNMFIDKEDSKQEWFASCLHNEFMKDYVSNDIEESIKTLLRLDEPEIFVDRGWGDSPLAISVINDGNGQFPFLYISEEIYKELIDKKYIGSNILNSYKNRKLHSFNKDYYLILNKK